MDRNSHSGDLQKWFKKSLNGIQIILFSEMLKISKTTYLFVREQILVKEKEEYIETLKKYSNF
jgi:hypothetical protein